MVGRRSRRAELEGEVCQWSLDFSPVGKDWVGGLDLGGDDEEQLVGISSASREALLMPHEGHYCCLGRGTTDAY